MHGRGRGREQDPAVGAQPAVDGECRAGDVGGTGEVEEQDLRLLARVGPPLLGIRLVRSEPRSGSAAWRAVSAVAVLPGAIALIRMFCAA